MARLRGTVSGDTTAGYETVCEHCGTGVEVIIAPKEGESYVVPRSVVDQLMRIAGRLDQMGVRIIQIQGVEKGHSGDAQDTGDEDSGPVAPEERSPE